MKLKDIVNRIASFFKHKENKNVDYSVKNIDISFFEIPYSAFLVIKKYGLIAFFYKLANYIKLVSIKNFNKVKNISRSGNLVKKAFLVLRQDGLFVFLSLSYQYLIRKKKCLESRTAAKIQSNYEKWIEKNEKWDKEKIKKEIKNFKYKPKISIITPVYNVDPRWLDKCIQSVKNQFYENWELCLHDDASTNQDTIKCLKKWEESDKRIKVSYSRKNQHISGASNEALKLATGEFIALLDNDDTLSCDALFENAKLLNLFPDTDLIYSDEDKIRTGKDGKDERFSPFFKPDWDPQMLFDYMYTGHLSIYRKKIVEDAGMFRSEFDFSQDYDLALRVVQMTDKIKHIPKILYHWRAIPSSGAQGGKDYARESNIAACQSAINRLGIKGKVVEYPHVNRVVPKLAQVKLVSIIIPSDNEKNIINCVNLILKNSSYKKFEIIIVTNSGIGKKILNLYKNIKKVRICNFDKQFNFSLKCNEGAKKAEGDFFVFLNDDIEIEQTDWMENMIRLFAYKKVGAVSPKLFYENDTIQYAGMITGVRGFIQTAFHCQPKDSHFYFSFAQIERSVSILSGACLCIRKNVFNEVGGFDYINTPIMHSDVDLSFRIRELGYNLVYTPFTSLRHKGHLSLKEEDKKNKNINDPADMYIVKRWGDYLSYDPYFPNNMKEYLLHEDGSEFEFIAKRQEDEFFTAKNLLFISHDLSLSGAPIVLYYLAKFLKKHGFFVTVLSPYNGTLANYYTKENIPVVVDSTIANNPYNEFDKFIANYDFVILNTIIMSHLISRIKKLNIALAWFIHESKFGREYMSSHKEVLFGFKHADDIIFPCKETADIYKNFINTNVCIIPNGIESFTCLESESKITKNKTSRLRIIHVGSIEPRKGQDILIESLKYIPKHLRAQFSVVFVGRVLNSNFWLKIKKIASKYDNIEFTGQVSLNRVHEMVQKSDIFVCSSRDEVFPLTILEAMSYGKPIIATDVGGVKNMVKNKYNGFLVKNENSKAIAKSIMFFLNNMGFIKKYGENARKNFCDNFTIEKTGNKVISVINSRINSR